MKPAAAPEEEAKPAVPQIAISEKESTPEPAEPAKPVDDQEGLKALKKVTMMLRFIFCESLYELIENKFYIPH